MRNILKLNWENFYLKPRLYLPFYLSLLLNVFIWVYLIRLIPPTNSWLPIHYNVYFGIDWLGPWVYIFIFPFVGLILILANITFAILVQAKEPHLTKLLSWSTLVVHFFIILSLWALIINYFR